MNEQKSMKKYQVYFFLYLAVVCELLIIIVERDDAEARLLRERDMLLRLTRSFVTELVETRPVQTVNGNNQMEVGEQRRFLIVLQGMGKSDRVTQNPEVEVMRDGVRIQTLRFNDDIVEVPGEQRDGQRAFAFTWRAPAPGTYTFSGASGTDRLGMLEGGDVKIASLTFPIELIRSFVPDIDQKIASTEKLRSELSVRVIAAGDALVLRGRRIITAAGFLDSAPIEVQGTAADKVRIAASVGSVSYDGGGHRWTGSVATPGEHRIQLTAQDARGAGALSRASETLIVEARRPVPKAAPRPAYAGERYTYDISVAGLETRSDYAWKATLDGALLAQGSSPMIALDLPERAVGGTLSIEATYRGRVYPVARNEQELADSRLTLPVLAPVTRIENVTFSRNNDYAITQEFRFDAYVCGQCSSTHRQAPKTIQVSAESESGRDLLDTWRSEPILAADGRIIGTRVRFYLKGKVSRDGEETEIVLRADDVVRRISVIIYPD